MAAGPIVSKRQAVVDGYFLVIGWCFEVWLTFWPLLGIWHVWKGFKSPARNLGEDRPTQMSKKLNQTNSQNNSKSTRKKPQISDNKNHQNNNSLEFALRPPKTDMIWSRSSPQKLPGNAQPSNDAWEVCLNDSGQVGVVQMSQNKPSETTKLPKHPLQINQNHPKTPTKKKF